jgi:hypothetical protein
MECERGQNPDPSTIGKDPAHEKPIQSLGVDVQEWNHPTMSLGQQKKHKRASHPTKIMTVDLELLRNTTEELLCRRGVYDVGFFGWLNENDEDPEFIGYVMWTLNPPYDHDIDGWQNNTPPTRAPTKAEQRLMELGHDFFGLMKATRHFIGHALLHQPAVQPLRIDPTDFDFNEFAALVALTAAADRLSDFIIITTLGTKTNEEGERNKACDKLRELGLGTEADALQEGFKAIGKSRKDRVEVVHGLATQPARVQKILIARDREAFEKQRWPARNREAPYEDLIREQKLLDAKELADVEARAKSLCDCYVKLVKMGELSFRAEHDWRQRQKS